MIFARNLVSFRCACWKYLTCLVSSSTKRPFLSSPYHNNVIHRLTHDDGTRSEVIKQAENEFYHSFLARNKKYGATIAFLDYLQEQKPPSDISFLDQDLSNEHGSTLLTYLHSALLHSKQFPEILEDAKFEKFCDTVVLKLDTINEDHLLNLMKILTLWDESKRTNSFYSICRSIDKKIQFNYRTWGFDRCLLINDHFYRLRVIRYSEFVWSSMKRLWRDPNRLTSAQLVHAMFLVNTHRHWHPIVKMFIVENFLEQAIYELGAEECAILALAFFKTSTRVKSHKLLESLYQKIDYRISNIDSIPLTAFLKLFRFCSYLRFAENIKQLMKQLGNVLDKHSYFVCTHIALLGTGIHTWHEETFDKIAQRFVKEISTIRLKDIERTILAFGMYNYDPKNQPNVYELALNEIIKREQECALYPREMYSTISYLSLKGHYNFDLVDKVLAADFIKKSFRRKDLNRFNLHPALLSISNSIKLDCPDYSGNVLDPTLSSDMCQNLTWKIVGEKDRILSNCDKTMFLARSLLRGILGGPEFVHYTYVLPHLPRPDLIFCLDGKNPVKLPENILSKNYIDIKLPSTTEDWYVLTFFGMNSVIYKTNKPLGVQLTKLRQLNKLGYKVLYLKETEWNEKSTEDRIHYLRQLIEDSSQTKRHCD